jgi:hypothetical protein
MANQEKGRAMHYKFIAAADNYEPCPRNYLRGTLTTSQGYDSRSAIVTFENAPDDARKAVYILDFGNRVEVQYVSGWAMNGSAIYLQPFPLSKGTLWDGRPIDMSGWMIGPRRAFHLKLKEAAEDGSA